MILYAHRGHRFTDHARHQDYVLAPGQWVKLDDQLALDLARAQPDRLCVLMDGIEPVGHTCRLGQQIEAEAKRYRHRMVEAPPESRPMQPVQGPQDGHPRMSAQRRTLHRQVLKRSGIARRARAQNN